MKVYAISEKTRAAILNYLAERPYREVVEGIQALLSLPEIPIKEEAPLVAVPDLPKDG